jgi:hypothetical protein
MAFIHYEHYSYCASCQEKRSKNLIRCDECGTSLRHGPADRLKPKRKIICDFCSKKMTQFEMCKYTGKKRWRFHLHCLQNLKIVRNRQKRSPSRDIEFLLKYIRICLPVRQEIVVYQ